MVRAAAEAPFGHPSRADTGPLRGALDAHVAAWMMGLSVALDGEEPAVNGRLVRQG